MNHHCALSLLAVCSLSLASAADQKARPSDPPTTPATETSAKAAAITRPRGKPTPDSTAQWAGDESPTTTASMTARTVAYGENDVVQVRTKIRYTTLIILPKEEQILDFTCGDKEFWVVNGSQNFAYIKPAKIGAQTNLNLVTASGNIYSFFMTEVSEMPKVATDLKLFIEFKEDGMRSASRTAPRFVSTHEVEVYKQDAEHARADAKKAKDDQQSLVQQGINRFLTNVRFPYRFESGRRPFFVRAMYNDDKFTYLQARPEETPTLYEIKDGKPNLINFNYKDGVYVVEKVLDRGYLAIGKQKLEFVREN